MKAVKNIEESGRKSWLASVGVYSESLNKTTDKLDKLYVDGNALINDLVARGEVVEAELKSKLDIASKGKKMFEDKIAMLKSKLGMSAVSRDVQLERLSNKVDNLIEVVAKLAQQKADAEAAAKKSATKSTTTSKPKSSSTASKTSSAASKSTTATKPAASKARTTAKTGSKSATTKTTAKPRTRKSSTAKTASKPANKAD